MDSSSHVCGMGETTCFVLKLYLAGQEDNSRKAMDSVGEFCRLHLARYELIFADASVEAQQAWNDHVRALPSLVKIQPPPAQRLVGDFSDFAWMAQALGVAIRHEDRQDQQAA